MKLITLAATSVLLSITGCSAINKVGGNDLGVTYSDVHLDNQETLYPAAKAHCESYSKREKLVQKTGGTYIFECI